MEIGLKKKSRIGLKFLFRWKIITIEFALLFSNSDTKETTAVFQTDSKRGKQWKMEEIEIIQNVDEKDFLFFGIGT